MVKRDGGIVYEKLVWNDEELFDTQTNQPTDDLREIFKAIFGERDVWEIIDREGITIVGTKSEEVLEYERSMKEFYGDNYKEAIREIVGRNFDTGQKKLTPTQKKMFLKLVCDGKYTESDLIFIRVVEDFSSGFAFTRDAFCIGGDLRKQASCDQIIMYDEINSINFHATSWELAEKKTPILSLESYPKNSSGWRFPHHASFDCEQLEEYQTQIITERILWQVGKFLEFVKA